MFCRRGQSHIGHKSDTHTRGRTHAHIHTSEAYIHTNTLNWGVCVLPTGISRDRQTNTGQSDSKQVMSEYHIKPPTPTRFFSSSQHHCVYLSLRADGKCDCYTNKLDRLEQTGLSDRVEKDQSGVAAPFHTHTHTRLCFPQDANRLMQSISMPSQ